MKKAAKKKSVPRRAKPVSPQIFVLTSEAGTPKYARASIRVKAGQYRYLMWRDGSQVKNYYLGKRRED